MKLNTSLEKFKNLHKKKQNQIIFFSKDCRNYVFIENLYKFILIKKNSFIFESVEKGTIRGRYDHYLRFSGVGTTNEFKAEFYIYLSKCLLIYHQINKHFKNYKFIASVQSEQMFIPGSIIFQTALVNGANVYSRVGLGKSFTVRRYTNINERYHVRDHFSKKLYDFVNKNIRKEAIEIGGEIIKKRFEGLPEYQKKNLFYNLPKFRKIKKKFMEIKRKNITKEDLCVRLAWSPKTSIGVIFATDLTDGVFQTSWSLFRDRLTWLRETLLTIKKIDKVNWLVRPHPNDEKNNVITDTISEYEKICSNCSHIKLFPNDVTVGSIPKFIDAGVTMMGSPGAEYPCFGIPTIIPCESYSTGFGYTIEPKSKEEYFFQLENIKNIKKLNNQQIELAKILIFIYMKLTQIPSNLIAQHDTQHVDTTKYWTEMNELIDKYNYEGDLLFKMMKKQHANNDMHTLDYRMISKRNRGNTLHRLSGGLDDKHIGTWWVPDG